MLIFICSLIAFVIGFVISKLTYDAWEKKELDRKEEYEKLKRDIIQDIDMSTCYTSRQWMKKTKHSKNK